MVLVDIKFYLPSPIEGYRAFFYFLIFSFTFFISRLFIRLAVGRIFCKLIFPHLFVLFLKFGSTPLGLVKQGYRSIGINFCLKFPSLFFKLLILQITAALLSLFKTTTRRFPLLKPSLVIKIRPSKYRFFFPSNYHLLFYNSQKGI